jgi:hypothetical protein
MTTCYLCYGSGIIEEFEDETFSEKRKCECKDDDDYE